MPLSTTTFTKAQIDAVLIDSMGSDVSIVNAARVSFNKEVDHMEEKDKKLLHYLAKHGHWSPFAHTSLQIRCKVPIFLARQLVKHQVGLVWNEVSRRYVDGPVEYYVPIDLHTRPENAKQGSGDVHPKSNVLLPLFESFTASSNEMYKALINTGVAPEEARMVLPLNAMTEFIWTGSLMAFHRVWKQRSDGHAQLAAQEFAQYIDDICTAHFPLAWEALKENCK